jgi:hypothetical protein
MLHHDLCMPQSAQALPFVDTWNSLSSMHVP